jgi:alpha-galactosidase
VWGRGPAPTTIDLDLPAGAVDIAYGPPDDGWHVTRDTDGPVQLRIPAGPQARVLRVRHAGLT